MRADAPSSLNVLSRRFRPALLAFFLRRLGDHSEAEDLTQDVLVRLASHEDGLDDARAPDAYVFQTAANLLRDRGRRERVRARWRVGQGAVDALLTEERDPDRVLQGRQSMAEVVAALRDLSPRTREIFILFRLENMKQREIADTLGISLRAVEKHVMKASIHLHDRLGEPE